MSGWFRRNRDFGFIWHSSYNGRFQIRECNFFYTNQSARWADPGRFKGGNFLSGWNDVKKNTSQLLSLIAILSALSYLTRFFSFAIEFPDNSALGLKQNSSLKWHWNEGYFSQKRISLILAGMCPHSLSDTGLSANEAKNLSSQAWLACRNFRYLFCLFKSNCNSHPREGNRLRGGVDR